MSPLPVDQHVPEELLDDSGFAGEQVREKEALDLADGAMEPVSSETGPDPKQDPDRTPSPKPKDPTEPHTPHDLPQDPKPPQITDPDPGDVKW